jgi:Fic family protein
MPEFSLDKFIVNSNRIDIQWITHPVYDRRGKVITAGVPTPYEEPGDLMYDRQAEAWGYIEEQAKDAFTPPNLLLEIHRHLTHGVPFFEAEKASGRYRTCDIWIGSYKFPHAKRARVLVEQVLMQFIATARDQHAENPFTKKQALDTAWRLHHFFECAHPFIDGNGRTGRLLLNYLLMSFGHKPVVVYWSHRQQYYDKIVKYRKKDFRAYYDDDADRMCQAISLMAQ